MLKNIVITILSLLVVLFWLHAEPDDEYDDPDSIIIEYRCSTLDEYESIPPEVIEECENRAKPHAKVVSKQTV